MHLSRREVVKLGLSIGAVALLPKQLISAQQPPLIQRRIPSTGGNDPRGGHRHSAPLRRWDLGGGTRTAPGSAEAL